jgi:hypothetical protein
MFPARSDESAISLLIVPGDVAVPRGEPTEHLTAKHACAFNQRECHTRQLSGHLFFPTSCPSRRCLEIPQTIHV